MSVAEGRPGVVGLAREAKEGVRERREDTGGKRWLCEWRQVVTGEGRRPKTSEKRGNRSAETRAGAGREKVDLSRPTPLPKTKKARERRKTPEETQLRDFRNSRAVEEG